MTPILPRAEGRNDPDGRGGGLVLAATVGRETLTERLAVLRPLLRTLERGEAVLIDDGTLSGGDRVKLARQCGDPEIVPSTAVHRRGFPGGTEWALLLAALDRRQSAYWLVLDAAPPAGDPPLALMRAIASNRSFALVDDGASAPANLAPQLDALENEGWPYLHAAPGFAGFAAGGEGRPLAAAILARLEAALGRAPARKPAMAWVVANFVLAREREPVLLPHTAWNAR